MTAGARLADIAVASGEVDGFHVSERKDLSNTLHKAMEAVRLGRLAVVDVAIKPFSEQILKVQ